jgi:electron transfer flavoprotein beta subunit
LADGSGLDTAGVKYDINPFDEIAMEEAVRQKESDSSIRIVAVSLGEAECEEQLRKALAMGADEAILIETEHALDSSVVADELALLARELNPDLILMGKQATDNDSCQAGQILAAKLGWPQATFASRLSLAGDRAEVTRETDEGEETLSLPLPAVVTTDLRLNEPRYIALPGIIKARSKPLARRARAGEALAKVRVLSYAAPEGRGEGVRVSSVDELVSALKSKGVL